jgi:hypothetical protein
MELPTSGAVAFNVIAYCTGSSDRRIYPTGTVTVVQGPRTYEPVSVTPDWFCENASNSSSAEATCRRFFTYPRQQSKNPKNNVTQALTTATDSLSTAGAASIGAPTVFVERGPKRRLDITVTAVLAKKISGYPVGTFTPRTS